jgi:hypothetical protein
VTIRDLRNHGEDILERVEIGERLVVMPCSIRTCELPRRLSQVGGG